MIAWVFRKSTGRLGMSGMSLSTTTSATNPDAGIMFSVPMNAHGITKNAVAALTAKPTTNCQLRNFTIRDKKLRLLGRKPKSLSRMNHTGFRRIARKFRAIFL